MEDKPPQLLKLRLPAALLSSLTNHSRLTIHQGNDDGEKSSILISGGNEASNEHELQVEKLHSDWYQSKSTSEKRTLSRIGTTTHQYTVNPRQKRQLDTIGVNLKQIGAQTRKSLDEERKKRKEIVCLTDGELPPLPDTLQRERTVRKNDNIADDVPTEKGKRGVKKPRTVKRKRHDPTIDSYMPNTEQLISKMIEKEDRSNMIRLHGLPLGVKTGDIRKFFDGLNPVVFVLPSFNGYIEGWDAKENDASRKPVVNRYPETFRVYVKFRSALVADAAMERLGESIGFDVEVNGCTKGVVGAALSLSTVPKRAASFLLKHLVISTKKGELVSESLASVEKRIGTVTDFAWIMASKKMKLKSQFSSIRLYNLFGQDHFIPKDVSQYNSLVKVYNQLIHEHEELEGDTSLLLMHTFDPSCLNDSAHRITQSVSNWLLDEISILENNLCQARQKIRRTVCH